MGIFIPPAYVERLGSTVTPGADFTAGEPFTGIIACAFEPLEQRQLQIHEYRLPPCTRMRQIPKSGSVRTAARIGRGRMGIFVPNDYEVMSYICFIIINTIFVREKS
ncbi:MAG: hypothetical protein JSR55_05250 [Proteobacteria bacterium]|nr:hypothetical protein [Pseudomonadota bacterium]